MAFTKADIVGKIVDQLEYPKKDAIVLVESVLSILKQTLETGDDVKISGFGMFEVKQKKARRGRNPNTGEAMTIEARRIIGFKPSTILRDAINA